MTEKEARVIMKAHRWTYRERKRHKSRIPYIYAIRKKLCSRQQEDRYICPLSRLEQLTEAELIAKLTKQLSVEKPEGDGSHRKLVVRYPQSANSHKDDENT